MSTGVAPSSADILETLVRFDTTSRNSNLDLIGWIRAYLHGHGVHVRESRNADGRKANLHAIVGPARAGGIAFSGHVDTVPVDGQDWRTDPFRLHAAGDRLHARGAVDMKGFVASMLAAVPDLVAEKRDTPVHLFITYDEEVDCSGAHRLVDDIAESGWRPAACIVGEPSSLRPIAAHKGRLSARVTVRGRAAHSADPRQGANALHAAAHLIAWIDGEAERLAREGRRADGFEPPWSTTQVGLASGGAILNIVPEHARFDCEWRNVPGDDLASLLARFRAAAAPVDTRLRAVDPEAGVTIAVLHELPALALPDTHPLASLALEASTGGANRAGHVSYGTEAGIYMNAGIPTVVCGPGDIARAHKPDEWIGRSELDACDRFIREAARLGAARFR